MAAAEKLREISCYYPKYFLEKIEDIFVDSLDIVDLSRLTKVKAFEVRDGEGYAFLSGGRVYHIGRVEDHIHRYGDGGEKQILSFLSDECKTPCLLSRDFSSWEASLDDSEVYCKEHRKDVYLLSRDFWAVKFFEIIKKLRE